MNYRNEMSMDPKKRMEYKELKRRQDRLDLIRNHVSGDVLQRRNSMFTGIEWAEVEVFEQGEYRWNIEK